MVCEKLEQRLSLSLKQDGWVITNALAPSYRSCPAYILLSSIDLIMRSMEQHALIAQKHPYWQAKQINPHIIHMTLN